MYVDLGGTRPSGRYFIRLPNGRVFCVEPIEERVNRSKDWGWYEGLDVAAGGATNEQASIITEANGFKDIQIVQNPMDVVEQAMREDGTLRGSA